MHELAHVQDRVIVQVDLDFKNWHTFESGAKIRLERKYDCFDQKYTQPVNGIIISAEHISKGSHVIIHHNSCHPTNLVNNYKQVSGTEIASDIRYFSIPIGECFAWYDNETSSWQPLPGFDFALRIFKPYKGILEGVEHTLLKNVLWITTGEYKNNAVITLKASDYQLIFQDRNGKENNIIRLRTSENVKDQRESEIVALHNQYTEEVLNGDLYIGITKSDAKPLKELQHA